jgi:hypothetical protein
MFLVLTCPDFLRTSNHISFVRKLLHQYFACFSDVYGRFALLQYW